MALPQIAVIVGSNRRKSINRKLALALVKLGAGKFDAKIVRIDDCRSTIRTTKVTFRPRSSVSRTKLPRPTAY